MRCCCACFYTVLLIPFLYWGKAKTFSTETTENNQFGHISVVCLPEAVLTAAADAMPSINPDIYTELYSVFFFFCSGYYLSLSLLIYVQYLKLGPTICQVSLPFLHLRHCAFWAWTICDTCLWGMISGNALKTESMLISSHPTAQTLSTWIWVVHYDTLTFLFQMNYC